MKPEALVVLNPGARGGRGRELWSRLEGRVAERLRPRLVETDLAGAWTRELKSAGVRIFIAAGGDGTVNLLVNALAELGPLDRFVLGAVGLGSSNDFHKPYRAAIPLKVNPEGIGRRDVGVARYVAPDGSLRIRHFIVSAGMGVTARANAFFNSLGALKRRWTQAAILYSAGRTIALHRNAPARIRVGDRTERVEISNLSVLKTPYLSGSLRFDTPVAPDDGLFAVNLCDGMRRLDLARLLVDLSLGRFLGRPCRRSWRVPAVSVETDSPESLELDGEVVTARGVEFRILPEKIGVCR